MKNLKLFFIVVILFSSCVVTNYYQDYDENITPNFNKGKWLINHIESDLHLKAQRKFTNKLLRSLKKTENDSIFFIEQLRIYSLEPVLIRFDISPEKLGLLKKFTDYDYLLNTKVSFGTKMSKNQGEINEEKEKRVYKTMLHIYSIPESTLVYELEVNLEYPSKRRKSNSITEKDQRRMYRSLKVAIKQLNRL